jgi:hypothetical protein
VASGARQPLLAIRTFLPMARKMLVQWSRNAKGGTHMRHEDTKRLIPAAHLEVEPPDVLDELYEIGNAIDLAALAVIGMADELGGIEGHLLANYLRDRAELIRKAVERLSPNRPATVQAKPGNLEQLDRES